MIHTQDYYYIIYNHGKIVIDISLDIKYIIILWARKMEYLHYCYYYCQHYFLHQLLLLLQNLHNCCCCSYCSSLIWWSRILVNNICPQNNPHHSNILHMTCSCSHSGFFCCWRCLKEENVIFGVFMNSYTGLTSNITEEIPSI